MTEYLNLKCIKESKLFEELDDTDTIPSRFKQIKIKRRVVYDIIIKNRIDLINTLECLRYHMVNQLPYDIYDFVKKNQRMCQKIIEDNFQDFFYKELILLATEDITTYEHVSSDVVKTGNTEFVKYVLGHNIKVNTRSLIAALENKHNEIFKFLFEIYEKYDTRGYDDPKPRLYDYVKDNLEMLEYLHKKGVRIKSLYPFIKYSECFEYVIINTSLCVDNNTILDIVVCDNGFDRIESLLKIDRSRFKWNYELYETFADFGYLKLLKFLHVNGCQFNNVNITTVYQKLIDCKYTDDEEAIEGGLGLVLPCLDYMINEMKIKFNRDVFALAIASGKIEFIKYFHDNPDIKLPDDICDTAVLKNQFHVLKYLHENNYPISASTTEAAAKVKNYKIFKYLCDQDCEINTQRCRENLKWHSSDIRDYLDILDGKLFDIVLNYDYKYLTPGDEFYISINREKNNGYISSLNGYSYDSILSNIYKIYRTLIVEKIIEQQSKIGNSAKAAIHKIKDQECKPQLIEFKMISEYLHDIKTLSEKAIEYNYPYLLKYIIEHDIEVSDNLLFVAIRCKNYDCLKYLLNSPKYILTSDKISSIPNVRESIINEAAKSGSYNILRLVYDKPIFQEYDREIYYYGLEGGCFQSIKYLRKLLYKLKIDHKPYKINKEKCLKILEDNGHTNPKLKWYVQTNIKQFHE